MWEKISLFVKVILAEFYDLRIIVFIQILFLEKRKVAWWFIGINYSQLFYKLIIKLSYIQKCAKLFYT